MSENEKDFYYSSDHDPRFVHRVAAPDEVLAQEAIEFAVDDPVTSNLNLHELSRRKNESRGKVRSVANQVL
ncbi:hypothetical protein HOF56_02745 [Candidatus Peribacteria bacterium]|nr:hypothetical protein [Candidatus Peribacteria bacterium]MBT4021154.1 hypothetical protein [Candidatus Peribacteria bacterium]